MENIDIQIELQELPQVIWEHGEKYRKANEEYEKQKALYENEYDKQYLMTKASNEDLTVAEVQAEARSKSFALRMKCIELESLAKKHKNDVEKYKSALSAYQSIVKIKVAEMDLSR